MNVVSIALCYGSFYDSVHTFKNYIQSLWRLYVEFQITNSAGPTHKFKYTDSSCFIHLCECT
jgi:hypothetical protein